MRIRVGRTAGAGDGVVDVVQVTDSVGSAATANATVTKAAPKPMPACSIASNDVFPLLAFLVLPLLLSSRRRGNLTARIASATGKRPRRYGDEVAYLPDMTAG